MLLSSIYDPGVRTYALTLQSVPYRIDHLEAHVYAVVGVIRTRNRQPRDAVVTVAKDLDPHALIVLEKCNQHIKR